MIVHYISVLDSVLSQKGYVVQHLHSGDELELDIYALADIPHINSLCI